MSLDFTLAKIEDHESRCWIETDDGKHLINPVTEAIIFHTMTVGMNVITAANAEEFAYRVAKAEKVRGASVTMWLPGQEKPTPRPITVEDVRGHIGLRTNASPLTKAAFTKRLIDAI